jgi:hypothetical protein
MNSFSSLGWWKMNFINQIKIRKAGFGSGGNSSRQGSPTLMEAMGSRERPAGAHLAPLHSGKQPGLEVGEGLP